MLALWTPPTPFEALSLLDAKYASPVVRAYAVQRLHELDDRELSDFLLQLVQVRRLPILQCFASSDADQSEQVLKYEAYHYSPLAEFLLSRALMNVNQIGHVFFWLLKVRLLTCSYMKYCTPSHQLPHSCSRSCTIRPSLHAILFLPRPIYEAVEATVKNW